MVRLSADTPLTGWFKAMLGEGGAAALTDLLLGRTTEGDAWFDALGASAVKEVGNVLGAAYVTALALAAGWTIPISTPDLVYSRSGWAIELLAVDGRVSDYAICIETAFQVEGSERPV